MGVVWIWVQIRRKCWVLMDSSEMKTSEGGDYLRVCSTNKVDGVFWVAEILLNYMRHTQ